MYHTKSPFEHVHDRIICISCMLYSIFIIVLQVISIQTPCIDGASCDVDIFQASAFFGVLTFFSSSMILCFFLSIPLTSKCVMWIYVALAITVTRVMSILNSTTSQNYITLFEQIAILASAIYAHCATVIIQDEEMHQDDLDNMKKRQIVSA